MTTARSAARLPAHRRAVREDLKEARRQDVLDTAWRLVQGSRYEAVTVAEIGAALGLAKSTVLAYFTTKEGMFLAVLGQQVESLFAEVDTALAALERPASIAQVVDVWTRAVAARPALLRLLALHHATLEPAVTAAQLARFRSLVADHFARTGGILEDLLPFLRPDGGAQAMVQSYALVMGVWHVADQPPGRSPGPLDHLLGVPFEPLLSGMLTTFFTGLRHAR